MSKRSKQLKTTKTIKLQWIASIWRHNDKNVELRRNAFKTTQNYKSNQITMTCIYLMSKHWKQPKTKIVIILRWICIYLMSNRSKMLSYVSMHSKQHKTTKVIKLQWLASIWCQNIQRKTTKVIKLQRIASISCQTDQNNSKLQKRSNYNVLHRIDVKTIKNVAFRRKTFETTLNYKSNQITTICIDLTSKRSKILSYVAKHSKQRKTTESDQNTITCID